MPVAADRLREDALGLAGQRLRVAQLAARDDPVHRGARPGEYKKWYLGLEDDAREETKEHYKFPYGDF
jgi:hypothetical protein